MIYMIRTLNLFIYLSLLLLRLVDVHVGGALGGLLVRLHLRDVVLRHRVLLIQK